LPANIAGLQLFNEAFVSEINSRGNLSLETGKLIFHSKNCHIYERQYKLVKELLEPKSTVPRRGQTMKTDSEEQ
jgi:thymidylate synthase